MPAASRPAADLSARTSNASHYPDDHPTIASLTERSAVQYVGTSLSNDRERWSSLVVSGDGSPATPSLTGREFLHARPPGLALVITALCCSAGVSVCEVRWLDERNGQLLAAGCVIGRCPAAVVILPGCRPTATVQRLINPTRQPCIGKTPTSPSQ